MLDDPVILLLAGEASGDLHGAAVARALRAKWPAVTLLGFGGDRMEAEGVDRMAGLEDLAVMGFVEVAKHIRFFWRLERLVRGAIHEQRVDLVIPIDYPGFNLRISRYAKSVGVPVLYYIAPQVWAWRPSRARHMARDTDHVAVILPFEVDFLRTAGAQATFVGHPLLELEEQASSRAAFCEEHGLDTDRSILALFPGSRPQELDRHLGLFTEAARRLVELRPDLQAVVARAPGLPAEAYSSAGIVCTEHGRHLLRHAHAAIVKSGTSTVEAALAGVPFATVYRTHPLTFALARSLVEVDHIAMANLIAGRRVVPELIQGDATPERLEAELLPLVDDTERRRDVLAGLARVRAALGSPGAAGRVAELAAELLAGSGRSAATA